MHLDFCVTSFSGLRCCPAASRPDCKLTSSGPSSSLLSPAIARWSEAAAERTVRAVLARFCPQFTCPPHVIDIPSLRGPLINDTLIPLACVC